MLTAALTASSNALAVLAASKGCGRRTEFIVSNTGLQLLSRGGLGAVRAPVDVCGAAARHVVHAHLAVSGACGDHSITFSHAHQMSARKMLAPQTLLRPVLTAC